MMRKHIFNILQQKYKVSSISMQSGLTVKPYLVLKMAESKNSSNNSLGRFIYFEVLVYIPNCSITPMEKIVQDVIDMLEDTAEFTGRITQDYYDETVHAYTRTVEFRIPITEI